MNVKMNTNINLDLFLIFKKHKSRLRRGTYNGNKCGQFLKIYVKLIIKKIQIQMILHIFGLLAIILGFIEFCCQGNVVKLEITLHIKG